MKRIVAVLTLLAATASPAIAGGDWYDDDYDDGAYYEHRHWRGEYRDVYGDTYGSSSDEVYIPYYGAYVADEPVYPANCEIERKWRRGHYREKIECDDD